MKEQLHPFVESLIDGLHVTERPRIGSVIISIYGDAVIPQRNILPLSTIQELSTHLKFESGAVHTALSRLCSDGWFTRHKNGKHVSYELKNENKKTVEEAAQRIYGPNFLKEPKSWSIALFDKPTNQTPKGVYAINRKAWIVPDTIDLTDTDGDPIIFNVQDVTQQIPKWSIANTIPLDITREYQFLNQLISPMNEDLKEVKNMNELNALLARVLMIHFWRKIVLKHSPVYRSLMPQEWPGIICSESVSSLYHALLPKSQEWWPDPPTQGEESMVYERFKK